MRGQGTLAALAVGAALCLLGAIGSRAAGERPGVSEAEARIALGRRLFYDADLSLDGSMSCATCHGQRRGFAEGNRSHPGVTGEPGRRNVPGLANVGRRAVLTWGDSTLTTLEAQALVPITGTHPVEMGMKGKEAELGRRLLANACYRALFRAGFPEEQGAVGIGTVARALAAFQRALVSNDAPIDRIARGEAMPAGTQAGAGIFQRDCVACHAGPDGTDDRFHRVAALSPGVGDRGLAEVTGRAEDEGRFRTPSLRNVALSAPYFHDGAAPTLAEAIGRHEGIRLTADETQAVIGFLDLLTDRTFNGDPRFAYPDGACEAD